MDEGTPIVEDEKIKQTLLALADSESVYTMQDGPSNAYKMEFIRGEFTASRGTIFSDFPYQDIYNTAGPPGQQGAYYMCDLRIQALEYLIAQEHGDVIDHLKKRLINLAWKVRYREKINLHNMAVSARQNNNVH